MKTIYQKFTGKCNICGIENPKVLYDMPFHGSSWANVCEQCRPQADNPNHPYGTKIILGEHPNADPNADPPPGSIEAVLQDKNRQAKEKAYIESLSQEDLEKMMFDGVVECADGCRVEPDGSCLHGYSSPLILLGIL